MNYLELSFPSKKENLSMVRNIISVFLIDINPVLSFIDEIKTIASEAITNSIVHGYDGKDDGIINVRLEIENEEIIMHFVDYGVGIIDVFKAKEPLYSTKKDNERSGLGFTIMEIFSDELIVESKPNGGCYVKIRKNMYNNKDSSKNNIGELKCI